MEEPPFILLVEDGRATQMIARLALERHGCEVQVMDNAEDALAWAEKNPHRIDAAVVDVVLPNMGGRELVWRMRRVRPDLKVLVVSSIADNHALEGLEGDTMFLAKPFSMVQLWEAICDLLDGVPKAC